MSSSAATPPPPPSCATTAADSAADSAAEAARLTVRCTSCGQWNRVAAARASHGPKCGGCAAPIALAQPIALDDASFARTVRESTVPVLVDFYADWCGPCRMMAPAIDELARRSVGRAIIAKVDTEAARQTAAAFGIRGIPTLIVFRGGVEVARQSGAMPLPALEALLGRA